MEFVYSWDEIVTRRQQIAEKIMDIISQEWADDEYHWTNQKYLKKWYREKLTEPYLRMYESHSTKNGLVSKIDRQVCADARENVSDDVRREQSKCLRCFMTILTEIELFDEVLSDALWDYVYEEGTVEGRPDDPVVKRVKRNETN